MIGLLINCKQRFTDCFFKKNSREFFVTIWTGMSFVSRIKNYFSFFIWYFGKSPNVTIINNFPLIISSSVIYKIFLKLQCIYLSAQLFFKQNSEKRKKVLISVEKHSFQHVLLHEGNENEFSDLWKNRNNKKVLKITKKLLLKWNLRKLIYYQNYNLSPSSFYKEYFTDFPFKNFVWNL